MKVNFEPTFNKILQIAEGRFKQNYPVHSVLKHLEDWTTVFTLAPLLNRTTDSVRGTLGRLMERGLIERRPIVLNGNRGYQYRSRQLHLEFEEKTSVRRAKR